MNFIEPYSYLQPLNIFVVSGDGPAILLANLTQQFVCKETVSPFDQHLLIFNVLLLDIVSHHTNNWLCNRRQ